MPSFPPFLLKLYCQSGNRKLDVCDGEEKKTQYFLLCISYFAGVERGEWQEWQKKSKDCPGPATATIVATMLNLELI